MRESSCITLIPTETQGGFHPKRNGSGVTQLLTLIEAAHVGNIRKEKRLAEKPVIVLQKTSASE